MLWGRITCPTLLVYGKESWASNPEEDGRIKHFKTAKVVSVEGAGHWVHHDRLDGVPRPVARLSLTHAARCSSTQPRCSPLATPVGQRPRQNLRRLWRYLGPGLITGAADDDPSGIATYSQAGAQFGYRWPG